MTEILPAVPELPRTSRWWWQPLWHRHPIRFALVVLLVVAGGVAWGLPAGLALRSVVFPPKPPAVVTPAPTTPSPTPTHTRRRRTYAPQPVYTPPPTFHPTPTPTRPHTPSPRPTHTKKSSPPPPDPSVPICGSTPLPPCEPTQGGHTTPDEKKSTEHAASAPTKNSWSLLAWLL
jgi:hypothetical protein